MLFLNVFSLMPFLTNLWMLSKLLWFLVETNPRDPISKQFTDVLKLVTSVTKCAYLLLFSVCLASMFCSKGTDNSKIFKVLAFLSIMTKSGLCVVTQMSGGTVPHPSAVWPGRSAYAVNFSVSTHCRM